MTRYFMNSTRVWKGIWIKASTVPENQVPYLRKTFDLEAVPKKVSAFICSAGWHVLTVNGKRPDDRELAPSVSQYDKRVFYIEYDIAKLLKPGKNVILLELGNSLYNDNSHAASDFIRATWRDKVKVLCERNDHRKIRSKLENRRFSDHIQQHSLWRTV